MSRLVVVSNRVAMPRAGRPAPGGLAVGVLAALQDSGGVWFGWDGKVVPQTPSEPHCVEQDGITYATLSLERRDYEEYYRGYANRVLWPLLHYRLTLLEYHRKYLGGYRRVNAWFARKLLPLLRPEDVIWIHDYHLVPLASDLRDAGIENRIGFFLHTPFPPLEVLRALPGYESFLRWMLAYDFIGLQTRLDLHAFRGAMTGTLGGRAGPGDLLRLDLGSLRARAIPIGIDVDQVAREAARGRHSRQGQQLSRSLNRRSLIIGVDRLDYSKGLVERFRAYRQLLQHYPHYRGNVVLLQVAQPSRSDVPEYREIRHSLDAVAGEINGHFADFDWTPIRYLSRSLSRPTVLGFMALTRVAVVTPLLDGMNLVAKEFVAAQDPDDPGALVLSQLAGAAAELDRAVLVNPYDIDGMAEGLARALAMSRDERRERWEAMMQVLRRNDIRSWRRRFLDALRDTSRPLST
ncbi:MAG TPA: trehalose-6-phosphate synthase [Gammaproteobacteria bacterium]|nr:trehalose-6-phosphate synthase [Gammaproteobacteria bacterium]